MRFTLTAHIAANVDLAERIRGPAAAIAILATLAAFFPGTAAADPPTRVTVVAVFDPIGFGENAYVNGQLFGDAQGGQVVALEQSAPPFTDWAPVAQATADAAGYYSFKLQPSQTMQYRTSSQGTPSERVVQVSVAPRIKLKASSAGKSSIRFSGTLAPALDGQSITIQRRTASGGWTTVANLPLRSGATFAGRLRAHRTTQLRVLYAGDPAHLATYSHAVKATPGAKSAAARAAASACRTPAITRISSEPAPPLAARTTALQVAASTAGGSLYAIDVRWGDGSTHSHFTLAPAKRKAKVVFTLRHRFTRAGNYKLRVQVVGRAGGCTRTRTTYPTLRVISSVSRAASRASA